MFHKLEEVNARLDRARFEYREAIAAEHEAKQLRKPIQGAHERVRLATTKYDQALDAFIKFLVRKHAA
jgi:exonuclease VII small subunit